MRGETIEKAIEEDMVLKDVSIDEDLLWSFLLMGGYLKQTSARRDDSSEKIYYKLSIPNRESGYGRYDIMIIPLDVTQWGYVIEFKKTRKNETVKSAVESALKQIAERHYETGLVERGIKNYKKLAVVFKGKHVTIKEG